VAKWRRVGIPFELTSTREGDAVDVGWTWRIEGDAADYRQIRVIVAAAAPGTAEERDGSDPELRGRGERAIDTFLDEDAPPALIVVSSAGTRRVEA
jgi:hypothetical protein